MLRFLTLTRCRQGFWRTFALCLWHRLLYKGSGQDAQEVWTLLSTGVRCAMSAATIHTMWPKAGGEVRDAQLVLNFPPEHPACTPY